MNKLACIKCGLFPGVPGNPLLKIGDSINKCLKCIKDDVEKN